MYLAMDQAGLEEVAAPLAHVVTVEEAKRHLRVDIPDEDHLIHSQIAASQAYVERYTGKILIDKTLRLSLPCFPHVIELPSEPVRSIESITYVDTSGEEQEFDISNCTLLKSRQPAAIVPSFGTCWPATRIHADSVKVTYRAGYGTAAAVPPDVKALILLVVGYLYEHRGSSDKGEMPAGVQRLLDLHWTGGLSYVRQLGGCR